MQLQIVLGCKRCDIFVSQHCHDHPAQQAVSSLCIPCVISQLAAQFIQPQQRHLLFSIFSTSSLHKSVFSHEVCSIANMDALACDQPTPRSRSSRPKCTGISKSYTVHSNVLATIVSADLLTNLLQPCRISRAHQSHCQGAVHECGTDAAFL